MLRFAAALAVALTSTPATGAMDPGGAAPHGSRAPKPAARPAQPATAPASKQRLRSAARPTPAAPPVAASPAPSVAAAPASAAEPPKGSNSGLPLPRFASLKTDEVNLRTGPGVRYPIDWVYKRRDLPVLIEREFEVWRLIADVEGVKGWVHQATLTGRRGLVITGGERVVRAEANDTAAPVARVKPGVVGRLRACDAAAPWCQVQIGEYRGWLRRDAFWGISPGEAVQ